MNIKKNIEFHLSEDDVKEIIADYLKKEGYSVEAGDVVLRVGRRSVGYGPMEHDEVCFNEAVVKVKELTEGTEDRFE